MNVTGANNNNKTSQGSCLGKGEGGMAQAQGMSVHPTMGVNKQTNEPTNQPTSHVPVGPQAGVGQLGSGMFPLLLPPQALHNSPPGVACQGGN